MNRLRRLRYRWADFRAARIDARYAHLDVSGLPPLVSTDVAVRIVQDAVRRINSQAAVDAAERLSEED